MDHKELSERELLLLVVQRLDIHLEGHAKYHEAIDKRLDSHSGQLKLLWGGGGLTGVVAAWLGIKGSH